DAFAIMRPPSFFLSLLRLRVFASWRWSPRQNSELAGDVAKPSMSQTENREKRQTRERECTRSRLSRGSRCPSGIHEQRETTPRRQGAEPEGVSRIVPESPPPIRCVLASWRLCVSSEPRS